MSIADALVETSARVLVIDIETRPMTVRSWGLYNQNHSINQIVEPGGVICWAAKWYGSPKIEFRSDFHDGHDEMVAEAWRLMDSADLIIGFNHIGFDVKLLHREFVLNGYGPPSPHKDCDLLRVCRQAFRFPSNKLDWVSQELGIGRKVSHAGMELWEGCMADDPKSWATMRAYNKHDVVLTEELYDRVKGWCRNHPNMNLYRQERVSACHICGSVDLEDAGFKYTSTRSYSQFRCISCGGYSQATHYERAVHRKGA